MVYAHAVGQPDRGYWQSLIVREVYQHKAVVDIKRGDGSVLCLCANCGAVWDEGAKYILTCPPCTSK